MSQPNLLDIVPDQLFQNHFIADIDQVQKKLQYEIERKREDLRAMVGYVGFSSTYFSDNSRCYKQTKT